MWNISENWFQAELSLGEHWREDMELVRSVGFHTTGSPDWIWHTTKASILNKLRENPPKSGLSITELALQRYEQIDQQDKKKTEIKKEFQKAKKAAEREINASNWKEFIDPETGIVCKEVPPLETQVVWNYTPPPPPDAMCFICGSPVYDYDYPDLCLWCSKVSEEKA